MPKSKFDIVVEAVHYKPEGTVDWVRAYERRGATFSDHVLLDRDSLIGKLKSGERIWAGKRVRYMASTFELSAQLALANVDGKEYVSTAGVRSDRDKLDGVPVI